MPQKRFTGNVLLDYCNFTLGPTKTQSILGFVQLWYENSEDDAEVAQNAEVLRGFLMNKILGEVGPGNPSAQSGTVSKTTSVIRERLHKILLAGETISEKITIPQYRWKTKRTLFLLKSTVNYDGGGSIAIRGLTWNRAANSFISAKKYPFR